MLEDLNMLDEVNTLKDWGISLAIVVGGAILCKIISLISRKYLKKFTSKTKNHIDDILLDSIEMPILFGIMLIVLWIAIHRLHLPLKVDDVIGKAYHVLISLNVTWFFVRLSNALITQYWSKRANEGKARVNSSVIVFLNRAIVGIIWCIGIITALNNIGVKVTTLLSALGIGGVAIALASQDFLKNILGGFTLFTDQPFRIGDSVLVDNFEGTIETIGVRSTRIRLLNGRLVTMPNSKVVDTSITNISDEPSRQVVIKIGLTYNTTPQQMNKALEILRGLLNNVQGLVEGKGSANFTEFADSALIITYIYFIAKGSDILGTNSSVNLAVLTKFNEAGLEFAFPTQTLYLGQPDDGDAGSLPFPTKPIENKPDDKEQGEKN